MNYKLLRRSLLIIVILLVIVGLSLYKSTPIQAQSGYSLVWSDDFNGPTGAAPDATQWSYDTYAFRG